MKIILIPGKKGQLDRRIILDSGSMEAPTHLERCLWLRLLSENEYRVHTNKPPRGERKIISDSYGIKCPSCKTMIKGTNEYGAFHFANAIIDSLTGCDLEDIAIKYRLNRLEGQKLDELYKELQEQNFIGIIDTRKKIFTKNNNVPTDLPQIEDASKDLSGHPLTKFFS